MEDVKMTDVGEVEDVKSPESMMAVMSSPPAELSSTHSAPPLQSHSAELDGWIEILSKCRQLPEDDVKRLCDKVLSANKTPILYRRQEKYYTKKAMCNRYGVPSLFAATSTANSTTSKNSSV